MAGPVALAAAFAAQFGAPVWQAFAPGRVNLLGEHVDYNGGVVLPAAIERGIWALARPSADGWMHLAAVDLEATPAFALDDLDPARSAALPTWARYPAGVAWALHAAGYALTGLEVGFAADLPIGAGLSSSAALEVLFGRLWQAAAGWSMDDLTLAELCQRAENDYVGVACGLMDQFAVTCGQTDQVLAFDTRARTWETLPLPPDTALVIADSGVRRRLGDSAYNQRRAACETALTALQAYLPEAHSLRDVSPVMLAALAPLLPPEAARCAEHVVKEMARVATAQVALRRGEAATCGALMNAGHASLRDLFAVSTPELDALTAAARALPGCYGSRLTGAGFGGCTVSLVAAAAVPEFTARLAAAYRTPQGAPPLIFATRAAGGAWAAPFTA